ncbi:MAG: helix-turn-helix domain-containing protein [Streptosporangiaceae bacterium]
MQIRQDTAVVPEWTLGDRLKKAREHAGLSQTELGREIGISLASAMRYETGKVTPSQPVLLSWALCTGVDLGWLGQGSINCGCSAPGAWELVA